MSHNAKPYRKKNSKKTTTQSQKIDILFKQQHAPTGSKSDRVVNENEPLKQTQVTDKRCGNRIITGIFNVIIQDIAVDGAND